MKTKVTLLKIAIAIVLLMNVAVATAQLRFGEVESFAASLYVDPGASIKENGLDIGADIEYRGAVYAKVGVESFADLPGNYFDIHAGVGPRITIGKEENLSVYAGLRGGVVYRYSNPNPLLGFEFGSDYTFPGGIFVGANASTIRRGDVEKLYGEEDFWRGNFYIRIGYTWNWKD